MMTRLTHGTWVLIADGEKALFTRNVDDDQNPTLEVIRKDEQDNPANHEQAANRPGRFNDGPSIHRSAVDDTDWHQLAKDRFADDLAAHLYDQAHKGRFDRLVLVAPPGTLGELRKAIHKEVADKVIAEIPKTLTGHPLDKIEIMLRDELADK